MMLDALTTFQSPAAAAFSLVVGGAQTTQIGGVIDILGTGVGSAPQNIIGNTTLFGEDAGIGIWKPDIQVNIGTALAGGTENFALQCAPDTGAAGGYQPGTWETVLETGAKPASELVASTVVRLVLAAAPPATLTPRYYRMVAISGAAVTAGTVTAAFVVMGRDDYAVKQAANNYVVR